MTIGLEFEGGLVPSATAVLGVEQTVPRGRSGSKREGNGRDARGNGDRTGGQVGGTNAIPDGEPFTSRGELAVVHRIVQRASVEGQEVIAAAIKADASVIDDGTDAIDDALPASDSSVDVTAWVTDAVVVAGDVSREIRLVSHRPGDPAPDRTATATSKEVRADRIRASRDVDVSTTIGPAVLEEADLVLVDINRDDASESRVDRRDGELDFAALVIACGGRDEVAASRHITREGRGVEGRLGRQQRVDGSLGIEFDSHEVSKW